VFEATPESRKSSRQLLVELKEPFLAPEQNSISAIRSQFPVFERKVYLNSCSQGALSKRVEAAFGEYLHSWHEHGSPWDLWIGKYEEARGIFARFIGAEADEVALVASASAGVNSIASALSFGERRKVILGEFEFPTMGHIWLSQARRGAEIAFIDADHERITVEAYDRAIDRKTLIVPITHVCFRNGFRSPVNEVTRIAHDRGALVLLDDYQDSGTRQVDVKAMDLDFYVSGTLKYLLGPPGLAFLYVRKSLALSLVPSITGWFGQANPFAFDVKLLEPAPNARRFQAGTPAIPPVYGASEGVRLLQEIGLRNVSQHVGMLTTALMKGARELGIRAKTPADSVGPLVVLQAKDSDALVKIFGESGIVVSNRHDGLRISFHVYNTLDDVKAVLGLLERNIALLVTEKEFSVATK
jgi:selenocysteine lyase/cysteine desulfurase